METIECGWTIYWKVTILCGSLLFVGTSSQSHFISMSGAFCLQWCQLGMTGTVWPTDATHGNSGSAHVSRNHRSMECGVRISSSLLVCPHSILNHATVQSLLVPCTHYQSFVPSQAVGFWHAQWLFTTLFLFFFLIVRRCCRLVRQRTISLGNVTATFPIKGLLSRHIMCNEINVPMHITF